MRHLPHSYDTLWTNRGKTLVDNKYNNVDVIALIHATKYKKTNGRPLNLEHHFNCKFIFIIFNMLFIFFLSLSFALVLSTNSSMSHSFVYCVCSVHISIPFFNWFKLKFHFFFFFEIWFSLHYIIMNRTVHGKKVVQ